MKYEFSLPVQLLNAAVPFALGIIIPLAVHQDIYWLGVILATVGVFFSSGLRRSRKQPQQGGERVM